MVCAVSYSIARSPIPFAPLPDKKGRQLSRAAQERKNHNEAARRYRGELSRSIRPDDRPEDSNRPRLLLLACPKTPSRRSFLRNT
jgi:hypothetical protein